AKSEPGADRRSDDRVPGGIENHAGRIGELYAAEHRPADEFRHRSDAKIVIVVYPVIQADAVSDDVAGEVRAADRNPVAHLAFEIQAIGQALEEQQGRFQTHVRGAEAFEGVAGRSVATKLKAYELVMVIN